MDTFVPAAIYKSFTFYELLKLLSCSLSPTVYSAGDWQRKLSGICGRQPLPGDRVISGQLHRGHRGQRQDGQKTEKERLRQVVCLWDWL